MPPPATFQFLLENLEKYEVDKAASGGVRGGSNHCCTHTVIGSDSIMSNQPHTRVYLQLRKPDVENKDLFLYLHPMQHLTSVKILV
jgi:hypothetical protein